MWKKPFICFLVLCLSWTSKAQQYEFSAQASENLASANSIDRGVVRPPQMNPPSVVIEDGKAMLLFTWEPISKFENVECVYEFCLDYGDERIFISKTNEPRILYDATWPTLIAGEQYEFYVNLIITDDTKSKIISGKSHKVSYTYIPECIPPSGIVITDVDDSGFKVTWSGMLAVPGQNEYQLRYKKSKIKDSWKDFQVNEGNSIRITGVDLLTEPVIIQIRKICFWKDGSILESEWIDVPFSTPEIPTLPPFVCGNPYSYGNVSCTPPLVSPNNVTTITIGGFPIEVHTLIKNVDANTWRGTGLAPLPFGNQSLVNVEWSSIRINANREVCQGEITGVSDSPANYPNLNPGPAAFGGQICVPAPSTPGFDSAGIHNVTGLPWDPNGFGPDGKYVKQPPYPGYQPGFPLDTTGQYDPNGFDVNGIHALTGTAFNPEGCGSDGIDSLGQPCDPDTNPYAWMNPGAGNTPTLAGIAFVNENQDTIHILLMSILNSLNNQATDSLETQQDICNGIRNQMRNALSTLNIDSSFIFGANNQYFAAGMHDNFISRPEPLKEHFTEDQRRPEILTLETKHIELYDCDVKQYVFVHLQAIIQDYLGAEFDGLKQLILDQIKSLPESEINKFIDNPNYFLTWLTDHVKLEIQYKYLEEYGNDLGSVEPVWLDKNVGQRNRINREVKPLLENLRSDMLAHSGVDDSYAQLLLQQSVDISPKDIEFEYLQGFREVKGVHRAFYMDAICKQRGDNLLTIPNPTLMPISVANMGTDGKTYRIYLDDIIFKVGQPAQLDAYAVLDFPGSDQRIVFEGTDLAFTPTGLVANPAKIKLASDIHVRLNNVARLKLLAGDKTFVAFNCNGFAGIGIAADVEICRSIVKPYDPATDEILPEPERVNGHFETYAPNFTDIIVTFSMDPFVINGIEDVKWRIDGVTLDMSETASPVGTPPQGYVTPFANGSGFRPLWKGFYIKDIQVFLPRKFNGDSTPIVVGVHNLIIDDMGVSCGVSAQNILNLNQGNAGGWAFSVQGFELAVLMNNLSKAELQGKIHVPIFRSQGNNSNTLEESDCFNYTATIQPGNLYQFSVSQPPNSSYAVDMWKAGTVTISGSSIDLLYDGEFHATAILSGTAKIDGDLSPNIDLNIPTITFEEVEVSNESPYFSPGRWSFPTSVGAKLAGFELTFSQIGMVKTEDGDPALNFNAFIGITDDSLRLKAEGGFRVTGELHDDNGRQRWNYKSFKVRSIHIEGGFAGVPYIEGFANFYEGDPIYGTGFRGGLGAQFEGIEASIQIVGQFGRVSGFKYFFLDGLLCVGPGVIPIGPIDVRGLGGGVYYHMNRPDNAFGLPACSGTPDIPNTIGTSLSGITYTPDANMGIGIKLTVAIALTSSERAFNANATFEMLFNEGFGLDRIWIYGNAKLMDDLNLSALPSFVKGAAPNNNAAISANLDISLNFAKKTFDGSLQVYANVAGVLVGADNGKVCDASLHFGKGNDWYIKIGSPGARAGMILTIPGFGQLSAAKTYLQIGANVDNIPPLPADIAMLTGLQEGRKAEVESGAGFCFGVDLELGSKDFNFLMFYAGFAVHLGFDISVLDYGASTVCAGQNDPIGINGWYASGQIYAGIQGKVGIRVKVFGQKKEFDLLDIKVAAALEAKLPNPFWARGGVGFSYNILNGLVKGQGDFEFEIGEQCAIVGQDDPFATLPIILNTTPVNNAQNVPVSTNPMVKFNFPIGTPFQFEALNGSQISYEITLDEVELKWRNLYEIPVEKTWSTDKRQLILSTGNYLPGKDTFTLLVKVHVDSSGITTHEEERLVSFITGPGLSTIPPGNVAGSYPLDGQFNFFPNEITNGKGYIKLKRGQPELFFEENDYETYVRFRGQGNSCIAIPLQVDVADYWEKIIEFDLPGGFFVNQEVYEMQVVDFPKADVNYGQSSSGSAPCTCEGCTLPLPSPTGTTMLQTTYSYDDGNDGPPSPSAPPAEPPTEKVIYSAYFRVSQYNTFMEKMQALEQNLLRPGRGPGQGTPDEVPETSVNPDFSISTGIEPFDAMEMGTSGNGQALVEIKFDPGGVNWSGTWYMGLVDRIKYPYEGKVPQLGYGTPLPFPQNTVNMTSTPAVNLKITKAHFTNGIPANFLNVEQKIRHFTPKVMIDYYSGEMAKRASDYLSNYSSNIFTVYDDICGGGAAATPCDCITLVYQAEIYREPYNRYFMDALCRLKDGYVGVPYTYPIRITYRLPGIDQTTFSSIVQLREGP